MNWLRTYETIGNKFDINYVLEKIIDTPDKRDARVNFIVDGIKYTVKMNSKRYISFKDNIHCCNCGIKGSYFLLQRHKIRTAEDNTKQAVHFNLYAEDELNINDGNIILMTADHKIPKSKGGSDRRENLITMCYICNQFKGNK